MRHERPTRQTRERDDSRGIRGVAQKRLDHTAWLETTALLEQRRTLDDLARHNMNAPGPTPLEDSELHRFGAFAQERENPDEHDADDQDDEQHP
jgi:hypothetical protein